MSPRVLTFSQDSGSVISAVGLWGLSALDFRVVVMACLMACLMACHGHHPNFRDPSARFQEASET